MKLSPRDIMAGVTQADLRSLRARAKNKKCLCGNPIENHYGTCDECQDAAYDGDANGEW